MIRVELFDLLLLGHIQNIKARSKVTNASHILIIISNFSVHDGMKYDMFKCMLMESNFPRCRHTKEDVGPPSLNDHFSEVNNWPIIGRYSIRRNLSHVIYRLSKLIFDSC